MDNAKGREGAKVKAPDPKDTNFFVRLYGPILLVFAVVSTVL